MLMIAPMLMIAYMHTVQHLSAGTIKANKQTNMSMQAWTRISNIEIAIQPIQTSNRNNNKQRKSSSLWKIYHRFAGKYCFAYILIINVTLLSFCSASHYIAIIIFLLSIRLLWIQFLCSALLFGCMKGQSGVKKRER